MQCKTTGGGGGQIRPTSTFGRLEYPANRISIHSLQRLRLWGSSFATTKLMSPDLTRLHCSQNRLALSPMQLGSFQTVDGEANSGGIMIYPMRSGPLRE